mgnify:FL=1
MKLIYIFEREAPPALTENILRIKLEQRRLSRQTALLAAGGILLQTVILTLGLFAWNMAPLLTVLCGGSVLVSAAGSAAIAVLYTRRGGEIR